MNDEQYIELGKTKAIDIDFALAYPSTNYYVAVNMLIEFSSMGQVIPTRIDILPYKLSAFASAQNEATGILDWFKIVLVVYTIRLVKNNLQTVYRAKKKLTFADFGDNGIDLMVIFLQLTCFIIKM